MTTCSSNASLDVDTMTVVQGADATFTLSVFSADGTAYDLTGAKIYFTVKKRWKDVAVLIAKATSNAGGTDDQILMLAQTGLTKGKAQIFIVPEDTSSLSNTQVDDASNYVYDAWIVTTSGKHKPVRRIKSFEIMPSVTKIPQGT